MDHAAKLLTFLNESPSCYHATQNVVSELIGKGSHLLREEQPWKLKTETQYVVVRGDSSLIAFRMPKGKPKGFLIAAAHSDSPTFKVRESAEVASAGNCLRLSVEPYGGGIWRSWLDRPLSVAGRAVIQNGENLETRLVNIKRPLLMIPSVAIHFDREVNKGTALNAAVDLLPLFANGKEPGAFRRLIAEELGITEEELLTTELFLYPCMEATRIGLSGEFVASPRLDDLQCVYGCLQGYLQAEESDHVSVLAVFNNEEVGSGTHQGADSTFLTDVLERIADGLNMTTEEKQMAYANSFLVSADNAHAVHPAHPEYADKTEAPMLNGGIVLKYNANQRYTTDAVSAAVFTKICADHDIPLQRYSNRADLPGGSTLGNIAMAHLSISAVDIGLPQLAMHSCCELAGAEDTDALVKAMTAYFGCHLQREADGTITV